MPKRSEYAPTIAIPNHPFSYFRGIERLSPCSTRSLHQELEHFADESFRQRMSVASEG
jgi:hypothetical protein